MNLGRKTLIKDSGCISVYYLMVGKSDCTLALRCFTYNKGDRADSIPSHLIILVILNKLNTNWLQECNASSYFALSHFFFHLYGLLAKVAKATNLNNTSLLMEPSENSSSSEIDTKYFAVTK